jgi:hypothetical protein
MRCGAALLLVVGLVSPSDARWKGTFTRDDGRVMNLRVGGFSRLVTRTAVYQKARMRCDGDACWAPGGHVFVGYYKGRALGFGLTFDDDYSVADLVECGASPAEPVVFRTLCRIHRVVPACRKPSTSTQLDGGTLDLQKQTPGCRRRLRQG